MNRLLIANLGEIAIRIVHPAAELGIGTVAASTENDTASLQTCKTDDAPPPGRSHGDAKSPISGSKRRRARRDSNPRPTA